MTNPSSLRTLVVLTVGATLAWLAFLGAIWYSR
jgi:hypothetical protein